MGNSVVNEDLVLCVFQINVQHMKRCVEIISYIHVDTGQGIRGLGHAIQIQLYPPVLLQKKLTCQRTI